jgi:Tfp pilus assembly protein PilN
MTLAAYREMALAAWAAVRDCERWWLLELRGCLPLAWRTRSESHLEARVRDRMICVTTDSPELPTPIDISLDPQNTNVGPPFPPGAAALPVWLFPPPGAVLSRFIRVPRGAASRINALLEAESDRWTLFSAAEILHGHGPPITVDANQAEIELRFVARASAASWIRAIESRGLNTPSIVLGPEDRFRVPWQSGPLQNRRLRQRTLLIAAIAAAAVVAIAADSLAAFREQGLWQRRVAAERALLGRQREMETRIAGLVAIHDTGKAAPAEPRAMLLATLATALPASDWLTELSIKEETLTLRGYSINVEALLRALEPLARDRVVTVQGELAFDARLERHRFTVVMRTKTAGS